MFIPCVNNELFNYSKHGNKEQFEEAKSKVLFEGFELYENDSYKSVFKGNTVDKEVMWYNSTCNVRAYPWNVCKQFSDVESLLKVFPSLPLTESAKKQLE